MEENDHAISLVMSEELEKTLLELWKLRFPDKTLSEVLLLLIRLGLEANQRRE